MAEKAPNPIAQDALNRMARAHRRWTGCYLTVEMIQALGRTSLGEIWGEADPRDGKFYGFKPGESSPPQREG